MNKQRRKTLENLKKRLQDLMNEATNLHEDLSTVRDEEQDYLADMPENLQDSENAQKAQAAIDKLEEVLDLLDDFAGCGADDMLEEAAA